MNDEGEKISLTFAQWMYLSAGTGLLTGCGEVVCLGFQKYLLHQPIYFSWHVIWLAPLSGLLMFALLGLIGVATGSRFSPHLTAKHALGALIFLALLSWFLIFQELNFKAGLVLAFGLSWQVTRATEQFQQRVIHWITRCARMMVVGMPLLCLLIAGWQRWQIAEAPDLPASKPAAPNVLLIVMDTVRARNLSLYGYARPTTPRLKEFAKNGVRFDYAIATAPWTLPSHAGMFTGRYPHELTADFRTPLNDAPLTLAEALRMRGYQTAGFVANTYYCNAENGLAQGFSHYEDYPLGASELLLSASLSRTLMMRDALRHLFGYYDVLGRKSAADINQAFLSWLEGKSHRPFFAFLNYMDAHEPCLPPQGYAERFGAPIHPAQFRSAHLLRTSWRLQPEQATPEQRQADIDCYDGAITYLDDQIGRLLDNLRQQGVLDNTLVIITSDHGEAFGENGSFGHVKSAYLSQLHVPLIISYPRLLPAGKQVAAAVSLRDLPATVMDLLGNEIRFPGQSLARYWQPSHSSPNTPLLSEINIAPLFPGQYQRGDKAIIASVVIERYHYLKEPDGDEALFEFKIDPDEVHSLAEKNEVQDELKSFRYWLQRQTE